MRHNPPPLSDKLVDGRICSRDLNFPHGVPCGDPPFLHVCWELVDNGTAAQAGFVCERHAIELTRMGWNGVQAHEIGPDCQMPGAVWDFEANRCYVPETDAANEVTTRETIPA